MCGIFWQGNRTVKIVMNISMQTDIIVLRQLKQTTKVYLNCTWDIFSGSLHTIIIELQYIITTEYFPKIHNSRITQ